MNERSDITRVLGHWMDDGPSTMPDRVVDVVADRIARQRQRPARRLPGRPFDMNSTIKFAAAIAAVLVVALVGWNLLPDRSTGGGVGGGGAPSPSASMAPSGSPGATPPDWVSTGGLGALPAGTHTSRNFLQAVTYTVPAGWVNGTDQGYIFGLFPDTTSNREEFARADLIDQRLEVFGSDGYADSWGICEGTYDFGTSLTAADITAALTASENLVTTTPAPVTIGDLTGQMLDLHLIPSWSGTCAEGEDPPGVDVTDIRLRLILLDYADGSNVVPIHIYSSHAAEFDAFVTEAMPIVESFSFDLGSASS